MDTFIHYGMAAGIQAVKDAGLDAHSLDSERIGVAIGSGIGGLPLIENTHDEYVKSGVRKVSPFFVPGSIINMISGNLSIMYGFKGRISPSLRPARPVRTPSEKPAASSSMVMPTS